MKNRIHVEQSIDKIRLNIMALIKRSKIKLCPVVVLVSQKTGEGVTSVALALLNAIKNSENIRLLLIDADHKGICAPELLKLKIDENLSADNAFTVVPTIQEFDYVSMVEFSLSSVKLEQWQLVMDKLQDEYDVIIVDAGSLDSNNSYHWLNYDCYSVLVIDAQKSTKEILVRLSQRLKSANIEMNGFIMNKRSYPIPKFLYKQ